MSIVLPKILRINLRVNLQHFCYQEIKLYLILKQWFADADDVDIWMLDTLRLVSSEDVGRDEANVQSLLKKHKEVFIIYFIFIVKLLLYYHFYYSQVSEELKSYSQTVEALRSQANQLSAEPGAPTSGPEVNERMSSIDKRYKELVELAKLRHQRLLDALSLYKLFSEADAVQQWIGEKVIRKTKK